VNFVKTITKIYSYGFYRNLFHIFLSLIIFYMHLEVYTDFWNLKENENRIKNHRTVLGFNSARGPTTGHELQPNLAHAAQAMGRARAHARGGHRALATDDGTVGGDDAVAPVGRGHEYEHR
jgi:hypothetical protein